MARAARRDAPAAEPRRAAALAVFVLAADLMLIGFGFNPAVDPALGRIEPGALSFLAEVTEIEWGRVIGFGEDKVLWPNSAMRAGVPDLRGYDSIIPWWFAETMDTIAPQEGWLRFNRIGNPTDKAALAHPALAALGGRYVVTREKLDEPGLELIYDEEVRIYDNTAALPRAWVVNEVRVVEDRQALLGDLATFDPRREVLLEESPDTAFWETLPRGRQVFQATISVQRESGNSLELDVFAGAPGMLVLSEGYFPGWRAWVTPATAGASEIEVPIYRADGALRALPVPAGRMKVRLQYFPMSLKLGMYGSFLGLILLFLMAVYALWTRFVSIDEEDAVQRVALNSAGPIGAALVGKVLLFVFAMLYLRVLGPEKAGQYYLAVTLYTLADIITNFGLNLLVAREVARRPEDAPELLASSAALRMVLVLLALPVLALYVWLQSAIGKPLDGDTQAAIALLALALVPANLNTALSSVFQGLERMVLPAAVSILSTLFTVSLGALALLAGWGFVGLAGMAILTNWLTFGVLLALTLRAGIRPWGRISPKLMRWMAGSSLPLMLNHLLQVVFFKIDVLLLEPMKGSLAVGWYQSAYKWVEALLIIPAYLTMALFPLMSRRAQDDREGLAFAYTNTVRWLIALSLPIAVATTFLAEPLIGLLGGDEYLPQGAATLQIMIWFLPFSYVNGVTQYVLIALDRQRWITVSFAVAASFNIVANILVIPEHGHQGAAAVTIVSEIVLMVPFFWGLRDLGAPPLLVLSWRPLLGASLMAILLSGAAGVGVPWVPAAILGAAGYLLALRLLGWLTDADRAVLARLRPGGAGGGEPPVEVTEGPGAP
jgi:O-antigen/teichoic acid export membrane protein